MLTNVTWCSIFFSKS